NRNLRGGVSVDTICTRRRVMQLVAFLEAAHALEVRRGHGRGHVNFYRILREEDGAPVPTRAPRKVKSETHSHTERVKLPAPPPPETVQPPVPNPMESLGNGVAKVVETKERETKAQPGAIAPEAKAETRSPWWCPDCGYATASCRHRRRD